MLTMPKQQARFGQTLSSHMAAPVVMETLGKKMEHISREGFWKGMAVTAAIGMIPLVGVGLATIFDFFKNGAIANKQKTVLADYYKNQVAATLGIDPRKVTARELDAAARINPMIASAIAKVKHDKDNSNRAAVLGAAGAYATGAALAPVLGGVVSATAQPIIHMATHVAVDGAGQMAGGGVSSLFDKQVLHVHDVMEHLDEMHKAGTPITAKDVMMLRIAQSEPLQKEIRKHSEMAFHKMNEAQQQAVISSLPSQYWTEAQESAAKINSGQMDVPHLLNVPANDNMSAANDNPTSWTDRVGGARGNTGSWMAAEDQRRAAAVAAQSAQLS